MTDPDALREELRLVEEELAELHRTAAELRRRVGEQADAPANEADLAATITAAEEQEAFIAVLQSRHEALPERLAAAS